MLRRGPSAIQSSTGTLTTACAGGLNEPLRRCRVRTILLVVLLTVPMPLALAGCGNDAEREAKAQRAMAEAALAGVEGFDSLDGLVAELRPLAIDEDAIALLDLVRVDERRKSGVMTRRFLKSIARAQIDLADALVQAFPDAGPFPSEPAVEMAAFRTAMESAVIEQRSPVLAHITLAMPDGSQRLLIAERFGRWMLTPESMSNGEQLDDNWWVRNRGPLAGRLKFTRETAEQVRAGAFESPEAVQAHLDELMAGPMPGMGEVAPDPE